MTQTRTPRRPSSASFPLVVIALVVGLIVGLALALAISRLSGEVTTAPTSTPAAAEIQVTDPDALADEADIAAQTSARTSALGTDYGIVHLALGDADFTQAQVTEVLYAADRVCEGLTAEVPTPLLVQGIASESGMDKAVARDFVALVTATRC